MWCEFVNEAELPTLSLVKVVSGVDVADTHWQLFGTPDEGDVVTNPDGGDVAPTEVADRHTRTTCPKSSWRTSRDSNEFAASEWACVNEDGTVELTDSELGAATLRGLDKGETWSAPS